MGQCCLVSKTQIMPLPVVFCGFELVVNKLHTKCSENTQLQSQQMRLLQQFTKEDTFLPGFVIYNCLYYVWEGPNLYLSKGSKTGMCTLSADCLKNAYFQSSSHSSSLTDPHLLHFWHGMYLCFETATEPFDSLHYKISVWGGSTWLVNGMRGVDLIVHDWYR